MIGTLGIVVRILAESSASPFAWLISLPISRPARLARAAATPVMTFHRDGGPVRVVRLGELYPDLGTLHRTVSHWSWQRGSEWDGSRWTVHTVDGRVLAFAP